MPSSIDVLFERLKQFDEISLLELLDITSEDILERFKDKVVKRQQQLFGEVELFTEEEEEIDEYDGFQIEDYDDDDFLYDDESPYEGEDE